MIKEAYCSYEVSKLLKEKGMDKEYFTHYIQKNNTDGTSEAVTTCTHQMAMKWLREIHKLFIMILLLEKGDYGYTVEKIGGIEIISTSGNISYDTTEDAVEAALKYTLENLV